MRCVAIFSFLFLCAIVAISALAFTTIPSMKTAISYTKCSLFIILDTAVNGDNSTGWAGFT
jgi:hypothetical protein